MQAIPIHMSRAAGAVADGLFDSPDIPHTASQPSTCSPGSYPRSALLAIASSPLAQAPNRLLNHFAPILDPASKDDLAKCFLDGRAPAENLDIESLKADPAPACPIGIGAIVSNPGLAQASLTPRSLIYGAGSVPMPARSSFSASPSSSARPFPFGPSATPSRLVTPADLTALACSLSASRKAPPPPASLSRQIHALPSKPMGGLPPVRPDKEALALPTPMSLPHVAPLGPDWVTATRQRRDSGASAMSGMSFQSSASSSADERPERLRFKEAMQRGT